MRKNSNSKLVKSAILVGISAMLALSQPMAAMAGEFTDNGGDKRESWHSMDNGPDTEADRFNDAAQEAQKVHDASEEVQKFEDAAAAAETAASEAAEAVEEVREQVQIAEQAIVDANAEVGKVETATQTVNDAKTATISQNDVDEDLIEDISTHNSAVKTAQGTVNTYTSAVVASTTVTVPVETTEESAAEESQVDESLVDESQVEESQAAEGDNKEETTAQKTEADVADYAAAKAAEAAEAAKSAKEALENALAVDTDEVNDEVLGYAQDVYDAAEKAEEAKDAALDAVEQATNNLNAAVTAYNTAAKDQDLPLLVWNAEKEEYELQSTSALMAETDSLSQQLSIATTTADTTIQVLATTVADTQKTVDDAKDAYGDAVEDYKDAKKAADAAAQLVVDKVNATATEADKAILDDVNDAQKVYDQKADAVEKTERLISQKNEALGGVQSQLSSARYNQQTAQQSYDAALNARNAAAQAAYEAKVDELYHKWKNINGFRHPIDKTAALAEYEKYNNFRNASNFYDDVDNTALNNATTALNNAKATVSGLEGQERSLQSEINGLNNTLASQNAEKSAAEKELNAATAAQQSLEAQIQAAYAAEDSEAAKEALKEALDEVIKSYAVEINQTQYDKELNKYVNDVWNGWNWDSFKLISKAQLRAQLDKHYDKYYDNFWQNLGDDIKDIANIAGISQWLVNKDEVNELIDQCVALCSAAIVEQYKKQAVIDATYAKYNAEDTLDDATTKDEGEKHADITVIEEEGVAKASAIIDGSLKSMDDAITAYNNANSTYTSAKSTYEKTLAALENCSVSGVNLERLRAAVAAAQQKLAAAKASRDTAEEQASVASNYASWAYALTGTNQGTLTTATGNDEIIEPVFMIRASEIRALLRADAQNAEDANTDNDAAEDDQASTVYGDVEIPYALFRQFVQDNYEAIFGEPGQKTEYNTNQVSNTVYMWRIVDGVATELLKVVFDANGTPVTVNGEAVTALQGTFFVASSLSSIGDAMYDLSGDTVEINYVKPADVTPVNVVTTTSTTTSQTAVLGESREPETVVDDVDEAQVLGADRPQTGDASNAGAWAGVMGAAATALAGVYMASKKRKDEEEA